MAPPARSAAQQQAAQIDALVAAQSASRADLARAAVLAATGRVGAMAEAQWYQDQAVAQLAAAVAKQVAAAQRQTAALTDAYLARMTSILLGRGVRPVGPVDVAALRGLPSPVVYERLGENYRYLRAQGLDGAQALARTSERAAVMADTDATLAMRAQARKFLTRRAISGYRRIIRPEMSAGGTCGLCIAAADRIYHRSELMPMHNRCNCDVAPIVGDQDPGHSLNSADLDALYGAAGSTRRQDLTRVRIAVHHHGELGPVLGVHGQQFTGPSDLPHAA
jgi:hypothetical protein